MLRAVGVELQCVEARRRAGNLSFDFSTQQTVKYGWTVTNSQDLQKEDVNVRVSVKQSLCDSSECVSTTACFRPAESGEPQNLTLSSESELFQLSEDKCD